MSQGKTGKLTERRVKEKMESLGLKATKPTPDRGIDLIVENPENGRSARLQVKGRNTKVDPNLRWFQLRVPKREIEKAYQSGIPQDRLEAETWHKKVQMVDFFILYAVNLEEMWVLNQKQTFDLIKYNEEEYRNRPDNQFVYEFPIKDKQKEINIDVQGCYDKFATCKDNFSALMEFLGCDRR